MDLIKLYYPILGPTKIAVKRFRIIFQKFQSAKNGWYFKHIRLNDTDFISFHNSFVFVSCIAKYQVAV